MVCWTSRHCAARCYVLVSILMRHPLTLHLWPQEGRMYGTGLHRGDTMSCPGLSGTLTA